MLTETTRARAQEAYACFETAKRIDGETFTRVKEGSPVWVTELVHEAHGDFLPDDWRYACIRAALEFIGESDDPDAGEFADGQVDFYNGERLAWLGSCLARGGYCDDAIDEFGPADDGIYGLIGMGQYVEASEVFGLVLQGLAAYAGRGKVA